MARKNERDRRWRRLNEGKTRSEKAETEQRTRTSKEWRDRNFSAVQNLFEPIVQSFNADVANGARLKMEARPYELRFDHGFSRVMLILVGEAHVELSRGGAQGRKTLPFSKPFFSVGLINRRSVLRSAYAQFVFALSGADSDQMAKMRAYLTELCAGWDVQTVRDIVAETLHHVVDPLVYDEAVSLIEEHHLHGRDVVIVSASGTEVVEPIGEMLGADAVIATRMQIVEGKYSGEIDFYA